MIAKAATAVGWQTDADCGRVQYGRYLAHLYAMFHEGQLR